MKKLFKNIIAGMALGFTFFTLIGMVFDFIYGGTFLLENWSYTKMALGCICVGVGFSAPSCVYGSERIPYGLQILIHMGIGCTVMLITALTVGWIPLNLGWKTTVLFIIMEIVIAFFIWFLFSLHYKKEAAKMNKRLDDLNK